MEIVNMHEAKTRLSQLVDKAAKGEPVVIARAGKPVARVTAIDSPEADQQKRTGLLEGELVACQRERECFRVHKINFVSLS